MLNPLHSQALCVLLKLEGRLEANLGMCCDSKESCCEESREVLLFPE